MRIFLSNCKAIDFRRFEQDLVTNINGIAGEVSGIRCINHYAFVRWNSRLDRNPGIEIERRLKSKGLCPENLDAILVSHEHADHIQGVGVLSRRYNLPVYISHKTKKAGQAQLGNVLDLITFECGATFMINTLTVHPFPIS